MLFSRLAQSAAALLLLTIGFAAPVHAQQNQQIISGTWYEDRASSTIGSTSLTLTFAQTPTNQFLNITNVSCEMALGSSQILAQADLVVGTTSGSGNLLRPYSIKGSATFETQGSIKFYSIVQNGIFFKFGPGRYPSIQISAPTTAGQISASCVIVGNLTEN
jgi:hypothetical protein